MLRTAIMPLTNVKSQISLLMRSRSTVWILVNAAALALAVSTAYCAYMRIGRQPPGLDDADIFLVYGRNVAAGHGFVYNVGGERVEGFTSLLWVLSCAAAYLVTARPDLLLVLATMLPTGAATAAAALFLARAISKSQAAAADLVSVLSCGAILAWAFASPSFPLWTMLTRMDVALWCWIVTCGTLAFAGAAASAGSRRPARLVPWVVAAMLTRPEALLLVPVWIVAATAGSNLSGRSPGEALKSSIPSLAAYVASAVALLLFRAGYFGHAFPNTYYAKVSSDLLYNAREGGTYLLDFLVKHRLVWFGVAAALFWLGAGAWEISRGCRRTSSARSLQIHERLPAALVISCSALAGLLLPVLTGGDHFVLHRFYQPFWLLLPLPFFLLLEPERLPSHGRPVLVAVLLSGFALAIAMGGAPPWTKLTRKHRIATEFRIARNGRLVGHAINSLFPGPDPPTIGVFIAGGIALTYKGHVLDLMGLNSVAVAHARGDRHGLKNHAAFNKRVFYEFMPDIVIPRRITPNKEPLPRSRQLLTEKFVRKVLKGLIGEPLFRQHYVPVFVQDLRDPDPRVQGVAMWAKEGVVRSLEADPGVRTVRL